MPGQRRHLRFVVQHHLLVLVLALRLALGRDFLAGLVRGRDRGALAVALRRLRLLAFGTGGLGRLSLAVGLAVGLAVEKGHLVFVHALLSRGSRRAQDLRRNGGLAHGLDGLDIVGHAVGIPVLGGGLLGRDGQTADVGVVGAGHDHGLLGGRHQRLEQRPLVLCLFEHPTVHLQRAQPILFIHEGQQLAELSQEFLLVNSRHLRWGTISAIIAAQSVKVKKNTSKAEKSALNAFFFCLEIPACFCRHFPHLVA